MIKITRAKNPFTKAKHRAFLRKICDKLCEIKWIDNLYCKIGDLIYECRRKRNGVKESDMDLYMNSHSDSELVIGGLTVFIVSLSIIAIIVISVSTICKILFK